MAIIQIRAIKHAIILILGLLTAHCTIELTEARGTPLRPIEGVWVQKHEDNRHSVYLQISPDADSEYGYRFQMIELFWRELSLSGRNLFVEIRKGSVDTSPSELLLIQETFNAGRIPNKSTAGVYWPISDYGKYIQDRKFKKHDPMQLLKLSKNGLRLDGDDWQFRRALQTDPSGANLITEYRAGVVAQTDPENKRATFVTFDQGLGIAGSTRALWGPGGKSGGLRVTGSYDFLVEARIQSGQAKINQLVTLPGFKPGQPLKRPLTRREILDKIKRGEKVDQADLIRVLGKDADKQSDSK